MDWSQLLSAVLLLGFFIGSLIYAKAIARLEATVDRMEAHTKVVASELKADRTSSQHVEEAVDRMEASDKLVGEARQVIKDDLAASIERADAADSAVPGKSADAALRRGAE